jgi:hypothetical protein
MRHEASGATINEQTKRGEKADGVCSDCKGAFNRICHAPDRGDRAQSHLPSVRGVHFINAKMRSGVRGLPWIELADSSMGQDASLPVACLDTIRLT